MSRIGSLFVLLALVSCEENQGPYPCGVPPNLDTLVGQSVTDSVCFEDPDFDRLTYAIEVRNPDIITATNSGERITVTGLRAGWASIRGHGDRSGRPLRHRGRVRDRQSMNDP